MTSSVSSHLKQRLNPCIDIAFKKIFGVEENKDLLISLINSIVDPQDRVVEITILNPYNVKNFKQDKLSILDIKAKNEAGVHFNIEMQITDEGDYSNRALFYWAKLYADQIGAAGSYSSLCRTVGIHFLNFSSIDDARYHHRFQICDMETHLPYFDNFAMHTLELQKFVSKNADLMQLVQKIQTSLDLWMAFLTRNDLLVSDQLPSTLNDPLLKKAINVLDVMNLNKAEREIYEDRQKFLMLEADALIHRFNVGKAEGLAEGKAEGLAEGEAIGIEKGREEGEAIGIEKGEAIGAFNERRVMVQRLLSKNKSDDDIMDLLDITADELMDIKASLTIISD